MHIFKVTVKEVTQYRSQRKFCIEPKNSIYTNNVKEIINFTEGHVVNVLIYYWISLSV